MDKIPYISKKEFEGSIHYGCHYEGLVEEIGYVYWGRIFMKSPCPSYPNNNSIYYTKDTRFVSDPTYVPLVIPEDTLIDNMDISTKDIMDAFTRVNSDGSVTVTLFNGEELTIGTKNSSINIKIADEFFHGETTKVVTMEVEDKAAGKTIESKCKLKDMLSALMTDVNTASGILAGFASLVAEIKLSASNYKYLNELAKKGKFIGNYRGASTIMDESFLSTKRMRLIRGAEKAEFLSSVDKLKWVKYGGWACSFLGGGISGIQFLNAKTTDERLESGADVVIGTVGFFGPLGALISANYSLSKATAPYMMEYNLERNERIRRKDYSMFFWRPGQSLR